MSRRVRTLLVGGVLFLVLAVVAVALPVPYVILGPGPTINTLGSYGSEQVIAITGKKVNAVTGHLNLTTVSVSTARVTAAQAITGWLAHDRVVVPRETVYPPGQTQEQVQQQDAVQFSDSQTSAEGAAFCERKSARYFGVSATSPAVRPAGALRVADRLVSLDGAAIATTDQLQSVLATKTPGQGAEVVVVRRGVTTPVRVTLLDPAPGARGARMGISVANTCFAPTFEVKIGLNDSIGGPSAGMMFALGILEKVGAEDLTGGRFIAGTGTIGLDGVVGPIGGIQLKMIAARRAGASVFLAPAGNCDSVRGNIPGGLTVAKISTLHQAVQTLASVKAGQSVPSC